jgi:hypothetical protein
MAKRKKAEDLIEAAIVERAKSMANHLMWAVSLQRDRLSKPREQDRPFHPFGIQGFHEADLHFLVIALGRLRKVAATIEHAPEQWNRVQQAIGVFDKRIPWLRRVRDVFEHLEDYAIDSDLRRTDTSRRELQVWEATDSGINFLGFEINWDDAHAAAEELYGAVKAAYASLPRLIPGTVTDEPSETSG